MKFRNTTVAMKPNLTPQRFAINAFLAALLIGLALCGCKQRAREQTKVSVIQPGGASPLAIALAPHRGSGPLDDQIRHAQEQVRTSRTPEIALERLGWLFVAKARETFDPGFYKLAEQCAMSLEAREPGAAEALLLRGHTLQSQHRFHEAEALAQRLVTKRGLAFDYGLLGDSLVDLGRVDEAARAYQSMIDLKPDPQGYARAAHIRWLKGDLEGALEVIRLAAGGSSPNDPESAAWMHAQLARYLWQAGHPADAQSALQIALRFQTNFAPALLLRGRMELAATKTDEAIQSLRQAVQTNPLPEYQWALADALRAARREDEAGVLEQNIISRGPASDPRGCALFLATKHNRVQLAEQLVRQELDQRGDVFTHDALAWALAAAGKLEEAQAQMAVALSQGTQDARLFFHAAVIAARSGKISHETDEALRKAVAFESQLLPSEISQLRAAQKLPSASTLSGTAPAKALILSSGGQYATRTEN
jgi:tetratricopeptide (TPR) repeat protein